MDCIKCTELLEHVEYPEKVLDEISRILKPGGALILSVPFSVEIHSDPYDFHRFTDEKLRRMLEGNFQIILLKKQGLYFTVLAYMIKLSIIRCSSGIKRFFYPLFPILNLLVRLDGLMAVQNSKFMSSVTTGFFIVAVKRDQ